MKRFASVRFDGVLGVVERDEAMRAYLSRGATVTSWATSSRRSYATFEVPEGVQPFAEGLTVLRVTPDAERSLPALRDALAGPGAPAGIVEAYDDGPAIVVEFDARRSSVALVVAAIDAELEAAPGRTIEALVPLDDETLAAFAGSVLGEPSLDASRLIETYLEPLLRANRA